MVSEEHKLVWKGAIPLQLVLHSSEVTTMPPPSPSFILAPRNGYLPLLVPTVKPHFQSALPIGQDTVWFEYEGLPLKWHIPIGVLFDLLCFEPMRPWNLVVHFRSYSSDLLPYEGDDAMKWNFINSLKEASYVTHGSAKHVMNLSQSDQLDLWQSVVQGDLESYARVCSKLGPASSVVGRAQSKHLGTESEAIPRRIPLRLYIRTLKTENSDSTKVLPVSSWDEIIYIARPMDVWKDDGIVLTLWEALSKIAPEVFVFAPGISEAGRTFHSPLIREREIADETNVYDQQLWFSNLKLSCGLLKSYFPNGIIRIQGIEPNPDLPMDWVAQNLCAPDRFLHVCVLIVPRQGKLSE